MKRGNRGQESLARGTGTWEKDKDKTRGKRWSEE